MKWNSILVVGFIAAMMSGLAGCGDSGGTVSHYDPISVGSTWTYHRSDNGTRTQTNTAVANNQVTREVDDTTTGKSVATITISNNAYYLSSLVLSNTAGVYMATKTYSPAPGQLFLSANTAVGSHETQTVQVTTQPANTTATVTLDMTVAGYETVTVPAGTFVNALKTETVIGATTITSWFALNVGMIRQDVNNVTSVELTSYSIK